MAIESCLVYGVMACVFKLDRPRCRICGNVCSGELVSNDILAHCYHMRRRLCDLVRCVLMAAFSSDGSCCNIYRPRVGSLPSNGNMFAMSLCSLLLIRLVHWLSSASQYPVRSTKCSRHSHCSPNSRHASLMHDAATRLAGYCCVSNSSRQLRHNVRTSLLRFLASVLPTLTVLSGC